LRAGLGQEPEQELRPEVKFSASQTLSILNNTGYLLQMKFLFALFVAALAYGAFAEDTKVCSRVTP
jgi:hypothetical protein